MKDTASPIANTQRQFQQKHPLLFEGDVKFRMSSLPRLLGSRAAISEIDRTCYYCHDHDRSYICPGDEYVREVWKIAIGEFWENRSCLDIRFRHYPDCPWPFDDYEETAGRAEVVTMKRKTPSAQLRRAA